MYGNFRLRSYPPRKKHYNPYRPGETGMSQNIMKFSGANWYAVKTFTKILGISESNGIYLDNNAKVIESNLKSLARNTADSSNGFTLYSDTDYIEYNGKRYTNKNLDKLKMIVENEQNEEAINAL
jgi:hypothetical protein